MLVTGYLVAEVMPGPPPPPAVSHPTRSCLADGEKPGGRDMIPMEALGPGAGRCRLLAPCVGRAFQGGVVGKVIWFRGAQGVRDGAARERSLSSQTVWSAT